MFLFSLTLEIFTVVSKKKLMLWTNNAFSLKDEISNSDLCNIHQIKLLPMSAFAKLYDYPDQGGIPTRNNKFPEEIYTICNIHSAKSVCDIKETLSLKEWQRKILFFGTRLTNGVNTFFPLLYFANGVTKNTDQLFQLYNEGHLSSNPNIWLSQGWFVAVY